MKSAKPLMMIVTIAGLLAMSTVVRAQTSTNQPVQTMKVTTVGWSIEAQVARIDKVVKLTDDQKTKVKAALEDRRKAIEELKAQKMEWKERRAAAKSIHEQLDREFKEILTTDQYATYHTAGQKPPGANRVKPENSEHVQPAH